MRSIPLLVGLMACASPLLAQPSDVPPLRWGLDPTMPVETCRADGSREYLEQLRCADGKTLSWQRRGSLGPRTPIPEDADLAAMVERYLSFQSLAAGEQDHHMIDQYQLDCGGQVQALYMDMYHCDAPAPTRAPEGFVRKR